jgi:hypothetical protein
MIFKRKIDPLITRIAANRDGTMLLRRALGTGVFAVIRVD